MGGHAHHLDYDGLERALSRVPHGGTTPEPGESAAAALEEIASGERGLRAVRHPLGFLCLPLLRDGERGVCVHLYGPGASAEPTAEPLHAHSWELRSYVLYGRVANLPVRITEDTAEPTHRVFEVHSKPDGVDELCPTPRLVRGDPGPEHVSAGGQVYTVAAGDFHATVAPHDEAAATLVLGRSLPGCVDLSLGPLHGRGHRMVRQLCGTGQTEKTARAALRRMHADHR